MRACVCMCVCVRCVRVHVSVCVYVCFVEDKVFRGVSVRLNRVTKQCAYVHLCTFVYICVCTCVQVLETPGNAFDALRRSVNRKLYINDYLRSQRGIDTPVGR